MILKAGIVRQLKQRAIEQQRRRFPTVTRSGVLRRFPLRVSPEIILYYMLYVRSKDEDSATSVFWEKRTYAMGTETGLCYANRFVGFIEKQFFDHHLTETLPPLHRWLLWCNILKQTKTWTSFHPALKYTWVVSECSIAFLDINVLIGGNRFFTITRTTNLQTRTVIYHTRHATQHTSRTLPHYPVAAKIFQNCSMFHTYGIKTYATSYLVSSTIKSDDEPGTVKCERVRCRTCPFISNANKIPRPKHTVTITDHFTCISANLIYCITCTL